MTDLSRPDPAAPRSFRATALLAVALLLLSAAHPALPHPHAAACGHADCGGEPAAPDGTDAFPCPESCALCHAGNLAALGTSVVDAIPVNAAARGGVAAVAPAVPSPSRGRPARIRPPPPPRDSRL